jgi:TetR/AcrR family transcriptional repressor of nem operon
MIKKGEITREKVLNAAVDIINIKGYTNTSVNDIIDATGVKKGNLYFHFSSKEELGKSIILEARKSYIKYLVSRIKGEKPIEKLDSLIFAIYRFHKKRNFAGGCIFGNIALELSDTNPQLSAIIRDIFNESIVFVSDFISQALKQGDIKVNIPPEMLARHIIASIEGGIMMSKLSKDESGMLDCIKSIYILLGIRSQYFKI